MYKVVTVNHTQNMGRQQVLNVLFNVLLAVCRTKVQNIAYWSSFDLDQVLDLGDDLYKHLGLDRYLDVTDLPHHVRTAEGYNLHVNKVHLHDGESVIRRGERFILNAFRNGNCALLFINSTVTAIIYSGDSRGLSVANGSSFLLKFANILQLENFTQVAQLKYQGREREYFQLQFVEIEMADVLIDRNSRFVASQRNVRNNGVNQKKYTATIEHEKIRTSIQNQAATYDQNVNQVRWEYLKYKVRKFSMKSSKAQAKKLRLEKVLLENKLKNLESNMNNHEEYNDCKTQLEQIYKIKANGIKIRSKYEWYEHGEKSSKFFLNLEKSRAIQGHVRTVIYNDKKQMMKQKLIIIFDLFSIICIKKHYLFLVII